MEYTKEQQEQLQLISTCATIDEAVEKLCAADDSLTAEQAKAILADLGVEELEDEGLRLVSGGFFVGFSPRPVPIVQGVPSPPNFILDAGEDDDEPEGD